MPTDALIYSKRASHGRAFSLIELLLVIAITAVFAGMAAPRYASALYHYRLSIAAQRVAADLNLAQSLARQQSAAQVIKFDPINTLYSMPGVSDINHPSAGYQVNLADSPYGVTIVSANFGGSQTLTFNGFGAPSAAGSITLAVGGMQKQISVSANSGTITLQ